MQNQVIRVITGAMKSTPIRKLKKVTGIPELNQRRETKTMLQSAKLKCLEDHPLKQRLGKGVLYMTVESYSDNTGKSFRSTSYPWPSMRPWSPGNQKRQMSEFVPVFHVSPLKTIRTTHVVELPAFP